MGNIRLWEGRPLIDDGKIAIEEDCCCEDGAYCPLCEEGTTPAIMQVRFTGVIAGNNACGDGLCTDWNDTWFDVPQGDEDDPPPVGPSCEWYTDAGLPCIGTVHITLSSPTTVIDCTVVEGAFGITHYFMRDYGHSNAIDCRDIGDVPLDTPGGTLYCDWTNATCELRAKP